MNSFRYPILSKLAKKYLPIPATSVPSERAFSTAGHIVNKKKSLPSTIISKDAPILGSAYRISVYQHISTHIGISFFTTDMTDIELRMFELINCHVLIDG